MGSQKDIKRMGDAPIENKYETAFYEKMMEEMANAPREEYGKRQPGERCMYEIQRIENAANRNGT